VREPKLRVTTVPGRSRNGLSGGKCMDMGKGEQSSGIFQEVDFLKK
jgi:hypothetical protein